MSTDQPLQLKVNPITAANGFPFRCDDVFSTMMRQAISGGDGTEFYLAHIQKFADFAAFLQRTGNSAFTYEEGPAGSYQARAGDSNATIVVNAQFAGPDDKPLYDTSEEDSAPPVHGLATVTLQLASPESIEKVINLGVSLATAPPSYLAITSLKDVLFEPLVTRIKDLFLKCIDNWADIDLGDDLDAAGDAISIASNDAADAVSTGASEIAADGLAAEVIIDLSAAAPPLAILGALIAIPFIVKALEKKFVLHFELNNFTSYDFEWKVEYMKHGTMTSQPKSNVIPRMGYATDSWGDQTTSEVAYQADYTSMNTSGFTGIGLVLRLTPLNAGADADIAVVISIPWGNPNVIWLGDVPTKPDWSQIYKKGSSASPKLSVEHGNMRFSSRIAINSLSGDHDVYYAVIAVQTI